LNNKPKRNRARDIGFYALLVVILLAVIFTMIISQFALTTYADGDYDEDYSDLSLEFTNDYYTVYSDGPMTFELDTSEMGSYASMCTYRFSVNLLTGEDGDGDPVYETLDNTGNRYFTANSSSVTLNGNNIYTTTKSY
jgi:hypothetical protein